MRVEGKRAPWFSGCSLVFWTTLTHPTYPGRVLFHLVLVAMGTTSMSPPEAVLTELVIVTLLASIAKAQHTLTVAIRTLDRVEDWRASK